MSGINKNMESLSLYYNYKLFLDQLAEPEVKELLEKKKQQRLKRKEEQMRRDQMMAAYESGGKFDSKN